MESQYLIKQLSKKLHSCMNVDKHRFKRQLDRLRSIHNKESGLPENKLLGLETQIRQSIAKIFFLIILPYKHSNRKIKFCKYS